MRIKKALTLIFAVMILSSISFADKIQFTVGSPYYTKSGSVIELDASPYISSNGRTMLPLRAFGNALDIPDNDIIWNPVENSIAIFKRDSFIKLVIGDSFLVKNSVVVPFESPATILNGRTYIPLRAAVEAFGTAITWDAESQVITLDTSNSSSLGDSAVNAEIQDTLTYSNGDKYTGNISSGKANGLGTMIYENGDKYVGSFIDDLRTGEGTYTYANGDKYVGSFKNNSMYGLGTYIYADGDKYVGSFINEIRTGEGIYTYANGDKYVGSFIDGQLNGLGTYIYADGTVSSGVWANGILDIALPTTTYTPPATTYTPPSTPYTPPALYTTNSWHLVADDGTYLGKLTTNKYDSDSIFNTYGTYGSKYSSKSIWNTYGTYGSKYSNQSPFNNYTSTPPYITSSNGSILGRLTTNKYLSGAISPYVIYAVLLESRK